LKSAAQFAILFGTVGIAIPIVFSALWAFLEKNLSLYRTVESVLSHLQLLVWPTSIVMLGAAGGDRFWALLVISAVANAILYAVVGSLIWVGLEKQRWVLFLVLAGVILGWIVLLNL
jgi:hypothetical protein